MALYDKVLQATSIASQAENAATVKVVAIQIGSNWGITLSSDNPILFSTQSGALVAADALNKVLAPQLQNLVSQYDAQIKQILGI